MRDALELDAVKPLREASSLVRFAGLVLNLDACMLARDSGEGIPLTRGEFALLEDVRHQARTGYQPRHSAGRLHQPAFRAVRPQHRRADREVAEKDRGRSEKAATDRHRARRGLPLRRADADFVGRAKAFHRCPGVPGRRWTAKRAPWKRSSVRGASSSVRRGRWGENTAVRPFRAAAPFHRRPALRQYRRRSGAGAISSTA